MPDDGLIPLPDETGFGPMVVMAEDEPDAVRSALEELDSEFDPRHRDDFVGMVFLGKLEDECRIAGHRFLLATPDQDFRLAVGPLTKPYVNTVTAEQAWRLAVVASYLQRIDSEPRPEPLRGKLELRDVFDWLQAAVHSPVVIEKLFDRVLLLDQRSRELIEELDGLGKPSA